MFPMKLVKINPDFYWLSERSPYSNEYYWKDEGSKNEWSSLDLTSRTE